MNSKSMDPFFIVGIGASAGGLKAIEEFFDHMPNDSGAAFVVVQHLSPDFKSLMKELLERRTDMEVHRVEEGMTIEPNHVYLIPPRNNLVVRDGCFHLIAQSSNPRLQPNFPINLFFDSLAKERAERAIGVVLSGTGSDGALGLQSLGKAGGLALVQSPASAEFDGMPQSALATGMVDQALTPRDLASFIYKVLKLDGRDYFLPGGDSLSPLDHNRLHEIIHLLKEAEDIDFSYYKISTLTRRTARRFSLTGHANVDDYIEYLRHSPEEQSLLTNDLLIGVTRFFRDSEAWQILENEVIPDLLTRMTGSESIFRAWVSACATGEEAYSIAMLVDQVMERSGKRVPIKIFATDIDTTALGKASEGVYPESIAHDIPQHLLTQYFSWRNGNFHVNRRLREMIIFAPHNLTKNAGFTQMNLVTCRNVLIYMRPSLQHHVLRMLHFSLVPKGILFLGESESVVDLQEEFISLADTWKIFQKRRDVRLPFVTLPRDGAFNASFPKPTAVSSQRASQAAKPSTLNLTLHQALAHIYKQQQATCLLVDGEDRLLHVVVDGAELLQVPQGEVTDRVVAMLPVDLRVPVTTALNRSRRTQTEVSYTNVRVKREDKSQEITIKVAYCEGTDRTDRFCILVLIGNVASPEENNTSAAVSFTMSQDTHQRMLELEYDLQQTRENLQATIEELETTNEEQQATNEELLASNEELQSTNEELDSVNEELYTVNAEYQSKISELTELSNDIKNLLCSTDLGVIFLDRNLCIRKFTQAATQAINIRESDLERPLSHLTYNFSCDSLPSLLHNCLETQQPLEQEVKIHTTGDYLLLRLNPYRNAMGETDGIVLSFVPINDIKAAEQKLLSTLDTLESIYRTSPVGLCLLDSELRYVRINQVLADMNGIPVADHLGKTPMEVLPNMAAEMQSILEKVVTSGNPVLNVELAGTTLANPHHIHHWLASYYPVQDGIGVVVTDVTAIHEAQVVIAQKEERLNFLLKSSPTVIFSFAPTEDYHCRYISHNVEEILGYPAAAWLEDPQFWLNCLHPEDQEQALATLRLGLTANRNFIHQYRLRLANGNYRWFEAQIRLIVDSAGQPQEYIGSLMDIHAHKAAVDALWANEALFRLTLDQSQIMVFTQDQSLRYLWVYNPIEGFQESDFLGKRDEEIFSAAAVETLTGLKQQILRGASQQTHQFSFRHQGQYRYFKLHMEPLMDGDNQIAGVAGVTYEITQEVEQTIALQSATRSAQAANRSKGEFLANMSHELRTPLNSVLGINEALQDGIYGPLNERQIRALQLIENSSRHLLDLINDILDLSKIEAGHLELSYEPVNIIDLCNASLVFIRQQAHKKHIQVQLSTPAHLPIILCDERRIRQVLINLLANAAKFTPNNGQISLTVTLEPLKPDSAPLLPSHPTTFLDAAAPFRGDPLAGDPSTGDPQPTAFANRARAGYSFGNAEVLEPPVSPTLGKGEGPGPKAESDPNVTADAEADPEVVAAGGSAAIDPSPLPDPSPHAPQVLVRFQVTDTGIGIAKEQQADLFHPFVQVEASLNRNYEGTGLGLALVKRIVELHQGEVFLTSTLGKGSCFTIEIPCPVLPSQERLTPPNPGYAPLIPLPDSRSQTPPKKRPLVLLAEDQESNVNTLVPYLEAQNFQVLTARTGREAIDLLEQYQPDLIIMDIQMPDMDGLQATQQIRQNPQYANLPIVALTALAMAGDQERCLAAGVTTYFAKPVRLRELTATLYNLLDAAEEDGPHGPDSIP